MKINQLKAGAVLSYAQTFLAAAVSLLYTPVMVRLLGQNEYGVYGIAASVTAYLGILHFGFGSSYIRYYAQYRKDEDEKGIARLNGLFFIVFTCLGLLVLAAGFILAANQRLIFGDGLTDSELHTTKILICILTCSMAVSFPCSVFVSYITANERFVFQKLVNMIKTVIGPLATLPVLLMGYKSVAMVIVSAACALLADLMNLFFCLHKLHMRVSFRGMQLRPLREVAAYSGFIALNSIIDQINWNVDKLLLGRFHGSAVTAVYNLAAQVNTLYCNFSTSISSVFIPRVHKLEQERQDKELSGLFARVGRIQFMILSCICLGFIFFGRMFMTRIYGGPAYGESYYVALLLILPATIPLVQNLGIEMQRAKNKHRFRAILYTFMAGCNLGLSIVLCQRFGAVGSALGTAISLVVANGVIMNIYYHKALGIDILYFWKQILIILPALIAPAGFGLLYMFLIPKESLLLYLICGIVFLVIYALSLWKFGMNAYEKNLILGPLKRLLRIKR